MGGDWTALATTAGVICGAIGTLIGGLLTLWWTKGTESRVRIIKAESDAKAREQTETIARKTAENEHLKLENAAYEKRITVLEANYETLRQTGHDERNKWYEERLKCAVETAHLEGRVESLQRQLEHLQTTKSTPVTVTNPGPIPVEVSTHPVGGVVGRE